MAGKHGTPAPRKETLGSRIRELRLRKGWSQQDLAARVGVRQKQVSSYERDVNVPSGEIFIALAQALGVSLDYLAQRISHASPQATIGDLELLEKVQDLDKLDEGDRDIVKRVMDLVLLKAKVRSLAATGEPARHAEELLEEALAR